MRLIVHMFVTDKVRLIVHMFVTDKVGLIVHVCHRQGEVNCSCLSQTR